MSRFVVETPKLAIEAMQSPLAVDYIIIRSGDLGMREILNAAEDDAVTVYELDERTFDGLADTQTPQPVLAVVEAPSLQLDDRFATSGDRAGLLVLVDVSDPGNVGTLIRTAEAAGLSGLVVVGSCADPLGPKAVRASAGSVLRVPVAELEDGDATMVVDQLRSYVDQVVGTAMGGTPFQELEGQNVAYLLGSEAHGLRQELIDACDSNVSIPMAGEVESLNVATAGAVLAFSRQS